MNFIKFSSIIVIFFFIELVSGVLISPASGKDIIIEKQAIRLHFPIPEYYISGDIYDFCFDKNGALFISSENKIGVYKGKNWQFLNLQGRSILSVSDNGILYVANKSDVFQLKLDSSLNYSLNKIITLEGNKKIQQILSFHNELLINEGNSIFTYKNGSLNTLVSVPEEIKIYKTGSRILLQAGSKIANYSPINGLGNFIDIDIHISTVSDHPNGFLVFAPDENRFYIFSPAFDLFSGFNIPFSGIRAIVPYSKSLYASLTSSDELVFYNAEGKILETKNGLSLTKSSKILKSPYGRLWLNYHKEFEVFDRNPLIERIELADVPVKIEWLEVKDEQIYAATDKGLYSGSGQTRMSNLDFQYITKTGFGLLGLSHGTIYAIMDGNIFPVTENCTRFQWDERHDKLYLLRESKLEKIDLSRSINSHAAFLPYCKNVIDFTFNTNHLVVLNNDSLFYSGIRDSIFQKIILPAGLKPRGIINIKLIGEELFIHSNSGIYKYRSLIRGELLPEFISSQEDYYPLYNSEYYAILDNYKLRFYSEQGEESIFFPPELRKEFDLDEIYKWGLNTLIINGKDNLYYYNSNVPSTSQPLSVQIHKLKINEVTKYKGTDFEAARIFLRKDLNNIKFRNNKIEFEFSTSDYFSNSNHFYYRLQKGDRIFKSNIFEGKNLVLENLKPGYYNLNLVLLNDAGIESRALSFSFKIKTPFFKGTFAKILYLLIFSVFLFVLYRIYMIQKHKPKDKQDPRVRVEAFHKAVPEEKETREKPEFHSNIKEKEKKNKWDKYSMVTVLFSDIQGFTKIAESMHPEKLIDELDQFFFHFDSVVDKYDIEKIKTIGDAYMAAGGIPRANNTNPVEVVLAALEMQQYMKHLKRTKVDIWDLRIGIHTGPVIAGTIGSKKRSYDIWGDSVNIASRMESSGEPGKVNVSGETYSLIKEFFLCEYRGKIPVKYKGNLDMYFVKGLRPELSINLVGLPNRKFFLKLQLKRISDLEEYVFDRLQNELPRGMYFHNAEYTRQVYDHAYLLAKSENLDPEENLLVRTAGLLMNIGYLKNYTSPVSASAEMSRSILLDFKYSERQINAVSNLILSTKKPFEPQNVMEKILADASMNYIGRPDYPRIYKLLFLEENELGVSLKPDIWKEKQIKMLSEFKFFTAAARRLCEVPLDEQITNIQTDNL